MLVFLLSELLCCYHMTMCRTHGCYFQRSADETQNLWAKMILLCFCLRLKHVQSCTAINASPGHVAVFVAHLPFCRRSVGLLLFFIARRGAALQPCTILLSVEEQSKTSNGGGRSGSSAGQRVSENTPPVKHKHRPPRLGSADLLHNQHPPPLHCCSRPSVKFQT